MLFRRAQQLESLKRALEAAIAAHKPEAVQALLFFNGEKRYAKALAFFSGHIIADALTMLTVEDRSKVFHYLPRHARNRLNKFESFYSKGVLRSLESLFSLHGQALEAAC